jgi:hypothetical protein
MHLRIYELSNLLEQAVLIIRPDALLRGIWQSQKTGRHGEV